MRRGARVLQASMPLVIGRLKRRDARHSIAIDQEVGVGKYQPGLDTGRRGAECAAGTIVAVDLPRLPNCSAKPVAEAFAERVRACFCMDQMVFAFVPGWSIALELLRRQRCSQCVLFSDDDEHATNYRVLADL